MLRRSPILAAVVLLLLAALVGVVADRVIRRARTPEERAHILERHGLPHEAEILYWHLLATEPPTVGRVIALVDAHARSSGRSLERVDDASFDLFLHDRAAVSEAELDAFLAKPDLPADVALLGRFWRAVRLDTADRELHAAVQTAADAEPPMPWSNRLLAREAEGFDLTETAVFRYLREGRSIPEHAQDIHHALGILESEGNWARIGEALADDAIARVATPQLKARWAVEVGAWGRALRWLVPATYTRPPPGPMILAAVAALAWAVFSAQLGKVRERPAFRLGLYTLAFLLGTASVVVTDALILVEESKLHLVETGEPARDLLYFTFGVGLREEVSKLLLFLPLVPWLRRRGTTLDVLVAGAFVGLGFATMENLLYLAQGDLGTGLGRFLTANFLHMAMTSILASAAFDYAKHGDRHAPLLSRTAMEVMGMHGVYDFFLSHSMLGGGGYLAMVVFFLLANRFLNAVDLARGRREPDEGLFRTFVIGTATVAGASYVWASCLVGAAAAAMAITEGLLGSAILLYVFASRFRTM